MFILTQLQPAATRFSFRNHELNSRKSQAVAIDNEEALKAGRQISGAQRLNRRSSRPNPMTSTTLQRPAASSSQGAGPQPSALARLHRADAPAPVAPQGTPSTAEGFSREQISALPPSIAPRCSSANRTAAG